MLSINITSIPLHSSKPYKAAGKKKFAMVKDWVVALYSLQGGKDSYSLIKPSVTLSNHGT